MLKFSVLFKKLDLNIYLQKIIALKKEKKAEKKENFKNYLENLNRNFFAKKIKMKFNISIF